jgi:hypothetical protein
VVGSPIEFSFGTSVFHCTLSLIRANQLTNPSL